MNDIFDTQLGFTLGRQNLIFGDGFAILDGTPLDGSRSIYFDAARIDYELKPDSRLTAFYLTLNEQDENLPVVNDRDNSLLEQPEQGAGLYFTSKYRKTDLQGYYILKTVEASTAFPVESNIHTIGGRLVQPLSADWSITGEGGLQMGSRGDADRLAYAGFAWLDYHARIISQNSCSFKFGAFAYSGDDPGTGDKFEGWDPLFARWPLWSESYIYTQVNEGRVAEWTNIYAPFVRSRFNLNPNVTLLFDVYQLMAFQSMPVAGGLWGEGKNRGNLISGWLKFTVTENLAGHLLWERFFPGDFYFDGADDYSWMRFELLLKL